jgi:teichuronic acid biosynthesis glycosyltransferase TuaG
MSEAPLISILMPAYNAATYVVEAIQSVISQGYPNWELIIIDDGSTDDTKALVHTFQDSRIRYLYQENQGVSAARNKALELMQGDFFCFLDADDCFPENALANQVEYMLQHPDCTILGGRVRIENGDFSLTQRFFQPTFSGNPMREYVRLKNTCFFSITGFVRRIPDERYRFQPQLTHGEDLLFYIDLAANPTTQFHSCTFETYRYRNSDTSAMANLTGLGRGYAFLYRYIRDNQYGTRMDRCILKWKIFRIMTLSYLKKRQYLRAFQSFKYLCL